SLDYVSSLGIPTFRHSGVMGGAWRLAHRYGCSFYDAGYLALTAMTGAPFLHADGKLRATLRGRFPYELWPAHYSPGMNSSL
ncbi:MAG: type II toxin-antitoxin system VapC family toxin, partial [Chloroflexi bacterium]|nr:type II toxin-antitoxin system VapC family toxin [Chloroflexota bacterium]